MARGLEQVGWAVAHGETFCPSCARERNLSVESDQGDEPDAGGERAGARGIDAGQALEPFPVSAVLGERRGQRTARLLRASLSVLREDPQLLAFPAVAMALTFILGAFAFLFSLSEGAGPRDARGVIFLAGLVAAYPITFVSLYCGVALAAVLAGRLDGQPLTPRDGWMAARERLGIIAAWTLVVCTVGAALRLIERYVPLGAKILIAIVDLSWTLATMFAVPVLAYENLRPRDTFRRSSQIFRQRWGTQIAGTVGIGVASVFIYLPFLVLLAAGLSTPGANGALLSVLGGAGLFAAIAVQTALDQIFRVFVYRSAVGLDTTAGPFAQSDLQAPFARRKR
ncbi:MAG TPA: DUF6159 family protein [Solirubrobacteraceae bacterium]|nr:DUF6159 family protein [Solirubrobacteraceae bacterium]